ncbi:MAG: hypothetical protein LBB77_05390, partial [Treponema sp.]|nr:hypothetical protein [Treponema sp.]
MKQLLKILAIFLAALVFGTCNLVVGPDKPAGSGGGEGNLVISVRDGSGGRAITSGADLPAEVLAGMEYKIRLTGPNGEAIEKTITGEGTLSLTVMSGQWRIDAEGHYLGVLAGTGSVGCTVVPGSNPVRVPMMMSGPCYVITVDPSITNGTVEVNFTTAFEGTPI